MNPPGGRCCFPKNRNFEGFLYYKERSEAKYSKLYFVLANNFLLAANTPNATDLFRVITVEGKKIKRCNEQLTDFQLLNKKKRYHFRASDDNDAQVITFILFYLFVYLFCLLFF